MKIIVIAFYKQRIPIPAFDRQPAVTSY